MMDKRLPPAAAAGVAGAVGGLLAAVTGRRRLALFASALSGIGAWASLNRQAHLDRLEAHAETMEDQIRQLENAVAAQVQARMAAEEAVRSLTGQLAEAERRAGDARLAPLVVDSDGEPVGGGLTDPTTGLFNHDYFLVALDSRIAAARRHLRPVAVALLEVVDGRAGDERPAADPRVVATCIRETLRESDTATRLHDGRFGIVLEDTPENGAIWTMERVRRRLAQESENFTLWAGIACYPAHAFDVPALLDRAERALTAAHEWHQDRIEVATAD